MSGYCVGALIAMVLIAVFDGWFFWYPWLKDRGFFK